MTRSRWISIGITLLALAWAAWSAGSAWWTTDDAYISFRYARNLVDGLGLVFNEGERVEGFTNLLWTLWIAAGLRLGLTAEGWANGSALLCYLGSILLLALNHARMVRRIGVASASVPLAAVLAALHRDWGVFATGGLETSAFTMLLLAGFLIVVWNPSSPRHLAAGGAVLSLATLARPDGLLPAAAIGLFLLVVCWPRWRSAVSYAAGFMVLWLPVTVGRVLYYGDFFPNTYYAKSGHLPWYGQGWHYLVLYLEKYWIVLLAPVLIAAGLIMHRRKTGKPNVIAGSLAVQVVPAAVIVVVYTFWVVRVGGDFMYARFLIPVTPFLLLLLESGWLATFGPRPRQSMVGAIVVVLAMLLTPSPMSGSEPRRGVVDEWSYYAERREELDRWSEVLSRYFEDLPVRVAFYGDEARIVYRAGFPLAVESHTGLTEPKVARQEIAARGRVGHEKPAPALYLIEERSIHFSFSRVPQETLDLDRYIPEVIVGFDEDVFGLAFHWDPAIMAELARRGARIPDFPDSLDRYIERLPGLSDEQVKRDYERFKRFYFDHADDAERARPFVRRLATTTE